MALKYLTGMPSDGSFGRVGGAALRGRRQTVVMETVGDEDLFFNFFCLVQVI